MKEIIFDRIIFGRSALLTLSFRTAKDLCPNLQKPPLPSKIPGYAPDIVTSVIMYIFWQGKEVKTLWPTMSVKFYFVFDVCTNKTLPNIKRSHILAENGILGPYSESFWSIFFHVRTECGPGWLQVRAIRIYRLY